LKKAGQELATAYRDSRAATVKHAKTKAAPEELSGGKRRVVVTKHAVGWWGSEALHGFPVTRTGLEMGWRAHRIKVWQDQAKREEARTSHLEAQAAMAAELPQHRERQAAAQALIDQAQQPPEDEPAPGLVPAGAGSPLYAVPAQVGPVPSPLGGNGQMANATDTTYTTVDVAAKEQATQAEYAAADVAAQRKAAEQILDDMQALDIDPATLSSQADHVARLKLAEDALTSVTESGAAVSDGLQRRHGGLKEAHDDAPVRAAEREFYEE
jgi:hypothetical protein